MKSFVLFQIVFYSIIEITETYSSDLLINIGIPEQQFSMIFAILTLIGGISISLKSPIEKKFKNRTLCFISLLYICACIMIGTFSTLYIGETIIPIILVLYTIQKICTSIWYILEAKYLKNFTKEEMRNKVTFSYEFIGGIAASISSIIGGYILNIIEVKSAFIITGLIALACIIVVLDYMRTRFGLRPEEYSKEDIEFEKV